MKKRIINKRIPLSKIKIFVMCTYISIASISNAQDNNFKIGMFGATPTKTHYVNGCNVPCETPIDNGQKTSVLNVLSEDGFNIYQTYSPNEWTSEEFLKSHLKLSAANNFKVELGAGHYYKPNVDANGNYLGNGTNVYDNCGNTISSCQSPWLQNYFRADINKYISNIYNVAPYKDIIWGYHICEEASFYHHFHFANDCQGNAWSNPNYFKNVELPPSNVEGAISHFKSNTPSDHKMIVMEANHHKNINSNTNDGEGVYNPQHYLSLLNTNNKQDVFFEGSYTQFPSSGWNQQNYSNMYNDGYHYLGSFKSIDYAYNYSSEVHKVINIAGTSGGSNYLAHYHSNTSVPNGNWLWFQTYTSIIHGAKGVWFWDLNYSWNNGETNSFNNNSINNRFERNYFPENYRNFISYLGKELRYLADKRFVSSDPNTVIYSKKDEVDPNCIVPSANTYIPSNYGGINLNNHRNENYGLRYTIRTNGDEVIMIISNPLNVPVTATLNFDNVGNSVIKNAYGVDVLFEANTSVTSSTYKTDRNSNINLSDGTLGQQYYKGFSNGKNLTLSFGSMDVHVLKFRSNPPVSYNNGWQKVWSNYGSGKINGWDVKSFDKFYVGDFDGDGAEELFCVQTGSNYKWMTVLNYENDDWNWGWSNYGNNHMMLSYRDNFVVGDFDGDGKDELLGNDIDGWTTMFNFENNSWQWGWSDYGNHSIRSYKDNLVAGDFDGDGKDEILGCDLPNGWTTMFNFDNNNFQWGWSDYGSNHAIRPYRYTLKTGDFDGDGKDEILGSDLPNGWTTMFNFDNNNFQWGWSTGGSNSFGGWTYPIPSNDQILIGDIDTYDSKDEIMFIQTGVSAAWSASMDLNPNQSNWNWNWSANNSIPYINDWSIGDNGGSNTKYILIKAEVNQSDYLMALRQYACSGNNYNYVVNMYKSSNGGNKIALKKHDVNNDNPESTLNQGIIDVNNTLSVYPNPNNGQFTVDFNLDRSSQTTLKLYSISGQLITKQFFNTLDAGRYSVNVNFDNIPNGTYLIRLEGNSTSNIKRISILK